MKSLFEKISLYGVFFLFAILGVNSGAAAFSVWTVDSYDPDAFEWTRDTRQGLLEGLS